MPLVSEDQDFTGSPDGQDWGKLSPLEVTHLSVLVFAKGSYSQSCWEEMQGGDTPCFLYYRAAEDAFWPSC